MKILHIIHQYLPEKVGGTELYTQTLLRHQRAQGDSVALFTPSQQPVGSQMPASMNADGSRIYRIPVGERSATAVFRSNFQQPILTDAFTTVLDQEQPDLVHIQHLMGLPLNLVAQIKQRGIPYLVTLHDYWYLCANAQLLTNYDDTVCKGPNWWLNCARCALARVGHGQAYPLIPALAPVFAYRHGRLQPILKQAKALISPTQFTANIYQQMGISADQIQVIPHGIELPEQLSSRPPQPQLHIVYIGGIAPQKGVHVLLAALNQLTELDVRLTIYGDLSAYSEYAADLQTDAKHPGIHFAGRLPHEQLWTALAACDVLVVPTLWYETASLIVQEAFAAKVPVIASDIGVLPERLRDGVDGLLFPPGDAAALAAILRRLAAEPALLAHMRAAILPVTSIQEHVTAVTAVYQKSLSE